LLLSLPALDEVEQNVALDVVVGADDSFVPVAMVVTGSRSQYRCDARNFSFPQTHGRVS